VFDSEKNLFEIPDKMIGNFVS